MALAETQNPNPPTFYQDDSPGTASYGSVWVKSDGTTYVYTAGGWKAVSGTSASILLVDIVDGFTYKLVSISGAPALIKQ